VIGDLGGRDYGFGERQDGLRRCFERADVAARTLRPYNAALIRWETGRGVSGVDGGTAGQQGMGEGVPAVIRKGVQQRVTGDLGTARAVLPQVADVVWTAMDDGAAIPT
jgi:hypothetical protein